MKARIFFCHGCQKSPEWIATGYVCPIWANKTKTIAYRHGVACPFNPEKVEAKAGKKINPLKAAKRARRGR